MPRTARTTARTLCGLTAVLLLAACGSDGGGPGTSATSDPSTRGGTTDPSSSSPAPTGPAGPTSGSGGLRVSLPCRGVVLHATVTTGGGRSAQLQLTNTGTSACTLFGYADVRPASRSGVPVSGAPPAVRVARPSPPTRVTLDPGGHAYAGLLIDASGACATGAGAAVTPPVDGTAIAARVMSGEGATATLQACRFTVGPLRATSATAHI